MTRRSIVLVSVAAFAVLVAIVAGRFVVHAPAATGAQGSPGEAPQTVSTVVAELSTWRPHVQAVGNLRALQGADLAFEIAGVVSNLTIASGTEVPAGTVLARLRLDDEAGRLAQLKANADLAAINLDRDQRQFAAQAVSHAIVDQDRATLVADRAQVAAEQALLDEKILVAPFAGRLGIRQVDLGQYLQPGTKVVTLQALDPIAIDFHLPQQALGSFAVGQLAGVAVDTFPGRRFAARIEAISPEVDLASRTALVRAIIDNHDRALVPGMFATIRIEAGTVTDRITLPQSAVAFATYGNTVFVVAGGIAHQVAITTGDERGDQVAVLTGVAAGQVVVSSGQTKLHDGTPVRIDNTIQPDAGADPHPPQE